MDTVPVMTKKSPIVLRRVTLSLKKAMPMRQNNAEPIPDHMLMTIAALSFFSV